MSETSGNDSEDSNSIVRKEQVEAALLSKPQRGRKRANLNAMERQELIRTRNREHAKETRIRKKMRQEELEEKERTLHRYHQKEKLDQERRHAVLQYVESRQKMLLSLSSHLDGAVSNDDNGSDEDEDDSATVLLNEVVHDSTSFKFNAGDMVIAEQQGPVCLGRLRSYDLDLATRIDGRFGDSFLASVQYLIRQGANSVSLDGFNGGTVPIDVVLSTNPQLLVQQGFLRFQFARHVSSKLASVHWWVTRDSL